MAGHGNGVLSWLSISRTEKEQTVMDRVKGKTAIVTGGATGLGFAIARRLKQEGAKVIITDVDVTRGKEAAGEIGGLFKQQDVASENQWISLIEQVRAEFGKLDILVNNAGISGPVQNADPESTSTDDWERIHKVNGLGVFLGCKHAIDLMRQSGGGSIINMSSIAALVATPFITAYGSSKAGVAQFTRSVALYCARSGSKIRCNSVHPGQIRTEMHDALLDETAKLTGASRDDVENDFKSRIPMGYFGEPVEIANMVLFLASDEARYITGGKFIVDGGMELGG